MKREGFIAPVNLIRNLIQRRRTNQNFWMSSTVLAAPINSSRSSRNPSTILLPSGGIRATASFSKTGLSTELFYIHVECHVEAYVGFSTIFSPPSAFFEEMAG